MRPARSRRVLTAALLCLFASVCQAQFKVGQNTYTLRGREQYLYLTPGAGSQAGNRPAVLFLPGDRGWAGKAVEMSREMASWGYDVYSLDTNRYLSSFTDKTTLTEAEVMDDLRTVASAVASRRQVLLVGWSAGAGLVALAAASPSGKNQYAGVIVLGLSDKNALAWRWEDYLSSLTRSELKEPTFSVKRYLADVSPVPMAMLWATGDEFVTALEARDLAKAAKEPKRYVEVNAKNHRFDGNDAGFYGELKESLEWALRHKM
jgi:dienelactone hydrolase